MWMTFQIMVLLCNFLILSGTLKFLIFYVLAGYYKRNVLVQYYILLILQVL